MAPRWTTALVTGASSGIGEALSRQLAGEGTNLIVVARDRDRLERLAADLRSSGGVEVEVLVADLSLPADRHGVAARIDDLNRPVDLVVNNAGFGTRGNFWAMPLADDLAELAVNVTAVVELTHAALGPMVQRGSGAVINVASVAGLIPTPGNATYGATKAYLNSFGESLSLELAGTGVQVTTVLPGFTRTEFHQRLGSESTRIPVPGPLWCTADQVAAAALAAAAAGRSRVVPGRFYAAVAALVRWMPMPVLRRVVTRHSAPVQK